MSMTEHSEHVRDHTSHDQHHHCSVLSWRKSTWKHHWTTDSMLEENSPFPKNHKKAGSGFWSPSWPDIWIFWIWIGLDIISLSTGSGSSKWNTMWPCKTCWYGMIVVWEKITMFRNHITESLAYLSSFSRLIAMFPATRDTNFQTVDISSNMQLGTVWRWAWFIL